MHERNDYSTLSKAIGIHILNFISIPNVEEYHNVFHITEKKTGMPYFNDLELHTVELKKFASNYDEELSDLVAKIKTSLDIWLAFLTRNDLLNKNNLPKELDNKNLKKALTVLDVMNFSAEEREIYEGHLDWLRVEAGALRKQEQKGFAKGMEEGIEKGMKKGKEEGKLEEKLGIAKKLKDSGMRVDAIREITGLHMDEIDKL